MTKSELRKGQDALDIIAAHGGPKMKAVPLDEESDPVLPRNLRYAIDALKRDAIRLYNRLDRVACDRLDRVTGDEAGDSALGAVRMFMQHGDLPMAGRVALHLRNAIARDVEMRRRADKRRRAESWREEALLHADALLERLLLCEALRLGAGEDVRDNMSLLKTAWGNHAHADA